MHVGLIRLLKGRMAGPFLQVFWLPSQFGKSREHRMAQDMRGHVQSRFVP